MLAVAVPNCIAAPADARLWTGNGARPLGCEVARLRLLLYAQAALRVRPTLHGRDGAEKRDVTFAGAIADRARRGPQGVQDLAPVDAIADRVAAVIDRGYRAAQSISRYAGRVRNSSNSGASDMSEKTLIASGNRPPS